MPDKGYVLGEEDIKALRLMYADWCNQRENTSNRPAVPKDVGQSPEVYVALTPAGGIPALSGTTPGSAKCQIYKINNSGVLAAIVSLVKPVYNLAATAVAANTYVQVNRDKFGNWLVPSGAGATPLSQTALVHPTKYFPGSFGIYDAALLTFFWNGSVIVVQGGGELGTGTGSEDVFMLVPNFAVSPNLYQLDLTKNIYYSCFLLSGGPYFIAAAGQTRQVYVCDIARYVTNMNTSTCQPSVNTTT